MIGSSGFMMMMVMVIGVSKLKDSHTQLSYMYVTLHVLTTTGFCMVHTEVYASVYSVVDLIIINDTRTVTTFITDSVYTYITCDCQLSYSLVESQI